MNVAQLDRTLALLYGRKCRRGGALDLPKHGLGGKAGRRTAEEAEREKKRRAAP